MDFVVNQKRGRANGFFGVMGSSFEKRKGGRNPIRLEISKKITGINPVWGVRLVY